MPSKPVRVKPEASADGGLFSRVVGGAASFVLDSPAVGFLAFLAAGIAVKCWWGLYPAIDAELWVSSALPRNPMLPEEAQYLMSSLGGPALARLLGVTSRLGYVLVHAAIIGVTVLLLGWLVHRRFGERAMRLALLALCLTPAPTLLLSWLGSYDPFTFLVVTVLALSSSAWAILALSFALGLVHFEQGVFVVAVLALVSPQRYIKRPVNGAALFGGLILGKALLWVYLQAIGITTGRLGYIQLWGLFSTLRLPVEVLPVWLYSLLAGAWVWVAVIGLRGWHDSSAIRRGLLGLGLLVIPTLMTLDQTRVYAMMSWPVILLMTLQFEHRAPLRDVELLAGAGFLAFLVAPAVFIWEFVPRYPGTLAPWGPYGQLALAAAGLMLVWWYARRRRIEHSPIG